MIRLLHREQNVRVPHQVQVLSRQLKMARMANQVMLQKKMIPIKVATRKMIGLFAIHTYTHKIWMKFGNNQNSYHLQKKNMKYYVLFDPHYHPSAVGNVWQWVRSNLIEISSFKKIIKMLCYCYRAMLMLIGFFFFIYYFTANRRHRLLNRRQKMTKVNITKSKLIKKKCPPVLSHKLYFI